jgi:RNA polymerase sigma-70 factor, ECF subfamily
MPSAADDKGGEDFLAFYDAALPHVYGYLAVRCRPRSLAEDLTAETFLAAIGALGRGDPPTITMPWIIGVARHKLIDHWRRQEKEERRLEALANDPSASVDPFDTELDTMRVREVLDGLGAHHRCALTLRYLDDLPVGEVAFFLGRSVHATEALLVRARDAFRRSYAEEARDG